MTDMRVNETATFAEVLSTAATDSSVTVLEISSGLPVSQKVGSRALTTGQNRKEDVLIGSTPRGNGRVNELE